MYINHARRAAAAGREQGETAALCQAPGAPSSLPYTKNICPHWGPPSIQPLSESFSVCSDTSAALPGSSGALSKDQVADCPQTRDVGCAATSCLHPYSSPLGNKTATGNKLPLATAGAWRLEDMSYGRARTAAAQTHSLCRALLGIYSSGRISLVKMDTGIKKPLARPQERGYHITGS